MAKVHWEIVAHNWILNNDPQNAAFKLLRAVVPDGWLVTIQEVSVQTMEFSDILNHYYAPGGITFVPDPARSWAQSSPEGSSPEHLPQ